MTVERKLKSLKTHFMSVHKAFAKRRLKADLIPGSDVRPKWFAYEALTFLNKGRLTRINRETPNTLEKQVRHELSRVSPRSACVQFAYSCTTMQLQLKLI